jgi:hypothetical protein
VTDSLDTTTSASPTDDEAALCAAAVASLDITVLDQAYTRLGGDRFQILLTRLAPTLSQDALRLAVLRFDLPSDLINQGQPPAEQPDDEHAGLRYLQPVMPP